MSGFTTPLHLDVCPEGLEATGARSLVITDAAILRLLFLAMTSFLGNLTCLIRVVTDHNPRADIGHNQSASRGDMSGFTTPLHLDVCPEGVEGTGGDVARYS